MAIVLFLLILSFLVIIHELGHFVTALWMKVKVEEFGIGYPPKALTLFRWKGVPFTLNWLPFGGFVQMQGEDGSVEDGPSDTSKKKSSSVGPFYTKSKRARLLVLLAGVFMNFVFGILAFAVIYTKMGIPTLSTVPKIEEIVESSPAQTAGFEKGDILIAIEQDSRKEISQSSEFISYVNEHLGQNISVVVQRGEEEKTLDVYARKPEERSANEGAIGIAFETVQFAFYPWWQMPFRGIWVGIQQSIGLSMLIVQAFVGIFVTLFTKAQVPGDIAGPVGIVHQASKSGLFQQGWVTVLNFSAMLSINLAILNILPIPALDGGRAVFVLLETIIGKKWRAKIEGKMNYVGFAMLLGLIGLVTLKDIASVVKDFIQ